MKRVVEVSVLSKSIIVDENKVSECVDFLDRNEVYKLMSGELSIVFMDNEQISSLHAQFMDDLSATDVITFHGDKGMDTAGEVCISVERANEVCKDHGNTISVEVLLYLVHGWLHLVGLNDKTEEEKLAMRAGEKYLLEYLSERIRGLDFVEYIK